MQSKKIVIVGTKLNKYKNVKDLMNDNINEFDYDIIVSTEINELCDIDLENISATQVYHLAVKIFKNYNSNNIFNNDGNDIIVLNGDINESINKICHNSNQKKYLTEHLLVFSNLKSIIETAFLVGQNNELKSRSNNLLWSYYLNGLKIKNTCFLIEFDVVSNLNGENHYRVQRLVKIEIKTDISAESNVNNNTDSTLEKSVSCDNSIIT